MRISKQQVSVAYFLSPILYFQNFFIIHAFPARNVWLKVLVGYLAEPYGSASTEEKSFSKFI